MAVCLCNMLCTVVGACSVFSLNQSTVKVSYHKFLYSSVIHCVCVCGGGGVNNFSTKIESVTAAFEIRKWKSNFPIDLVTHYDPVNRMAPCQGTAQLQFGSCDPL